MISMVHEYGVKRENPKKDTTEPLTDSEGSQLLLEDWFTGGL